MGSNLVSLSDLIVSSIGGGWGKETPQGPYVSEVAIIRGADFPKIDLGLSGELPIRWEKERKAKDAALRPGDIVLEISGGTDSRPTGRTLLITKDLLDCYNCPVIPASFCRLIRPDSSKVLDGYLYYYLQSLYKAGITWSYQNRSTGLSNFQYKAFVESEAVELPNIVEQKAVVLALEGFRKKVILNNRINDYLAA